MSATRRMVLALFLVAVIFFCAITIANNMGRFLRVDLTENKLYTLSEGTREVIQEIRQPLDLRLYYARTAAMRGPEGLRAYNSYYLYIRDLLREYESLSQGRLKLTVIDPRPHSEEELDATRYGLRRFAAGDESFFFGLAVVSEFGQEAVVPFFPPNRQPLVEYEISSAIYNAATVVKKPVGVLSSLPVLGTDMSPYMKEMLRMQGREVPEEWHIIQQLRQFYDVAAIADDALEIDPMELLIVIHPKNLPENHLFIIDQHVMRGGNLMVFVDPYCVADPVEDHTRKSSSLDQLLQRWGCTMKPNAFAADRSLGRSVQMSPNHPPQRLPTYLDLRGESFNRDDVITARLDRVQVLFGGVLKPTGVPDVTFEPILFTTAQGNVLEAAPGDVHVFSNPDMIEGILEDGVEPVVLGVKLTGRFQSSFPDGATVRYEDGSERHYEAVRTQSPETTIVVYSDVDMINNFIAFQETIFGVSPQGDNVNLFLNTAENLGGARALSTARAKGKFNRPFEVFDRIEAEAEKATVEKVAAVEADILRYRQELQSMNARMEGEPDAIMRGEAIEQKRDLEERLIMAQRELRELNRDKRVRIESLISKIKLYNTLAAPSVILLIAVIVFFARVYRKNKYLGVRHDE